MSKQSDVVTVEVEELGWRAVIDAGTSYGFGIKICIEEYLGNCNVLGS